MERRKTPRKDWIISKDETGRAVLEWITDPLRAKRMESDPCARTYDFLNRLSSPELALEEDTRRPRTTARDGFNPYDRARPVHRTKRFAD